MDVRRIARQPILDTSGNAVGYELLFRGDFDAADDDDMTRQTMTAVLLEFGLDAIIGTRQGWLNCTTNFIDTGGHEMLPAGRVVLEILEHQMPTDKLLAALTRAREAGYRLALDDYGADSIQAGLVDHVDVVKVDMLVPGALDVMAELSSRGVTVLAEKVEEHDDHARARDAGASLFQGYFFARPEVLEHRQLGPSAVSTLKLMVLLGRSDVELHDLSDAMSNDAALASRVLLAANSAYFGLPRRVDSVREAVVFLGVEQVRRLILLTLFSGLRESPSDELIRLAVSRAELCRQLAHRSGLAPEVAHTGGLLSVLDGLVGHPVSPHDLGLLGLGEVVSAGLVGRSGPFGETLDVVDSALGLSSTAIPDDVQIDTTAAYGIADEMTAMLARHTR